MEYWNHVSITEIRKGPNHITVTVTTNVKEVERKCLDICCNNDVS